MTVTVEKLKTAIANIEGYLSMSHDEDDTVTLTVNVIRSIKENYEELIAAKQRIETLENDCSCLAYERDAYKDVLNTAVEEAVKDVGETLKANLDDFYRTAEDGLVETGELIDIIVARCLREKGGESNADV